MKDVDPRGMFTCKSPAHAWHGRSGIVRDLGFSLIEVLLAVSIMSVIIVGLFSMFNQTQKALRATSKQVDILGTGRSAIELLVQDIQAAEAPDLPLLSQVVPSTTQLPHMQGTLDRGYGYRPVIQALVDDSPQRISRRTNLLQNTFFLTRSNLNWVAKGYFFSPTTNFVAPNGVQSLGFGTLFRFSSVNVDPNATRVENRFQPQRRLNHDLLNNFWSQYNTIQSLDPQSANSQIHNLSVSPLIEGVVHFKLQPIDSDGRPMVYYTNYNALNASVNLGYPKTILESESLGGDLLLGQTRFRFFGDALPAFIELELGVLDPEVMARLKAMPNLAAARQYLYDKPGAVHLFRRMVPLSTANRISLETQ
jgi:prepilin-type N-terminal cleavage/methylation domain-containing protein